jgi:hypothetical protein
MAYQVLYPAGNGIVSAKEKLQGREANSLFQFEYKG